jgi:hypothetical protein
MVSLSWRALGIGGLVVGGSASAALLVYLVRDKASGTDVLAIVAFIIAIIAFVLQLIFATAQSMAANQQLLQVEHVNVEAQRALAELRALTGDMQRRRDDQFETVLNRILPVAVSEAVGPSTDDSELADTITERLTTSLRAGLTGAPGSLPGPDAQWAERARLWAQIREWLSRNGAASDENLDRSRNYMDRLGADDMARLRHDHAHLETTMKGLASPRTGT